MCLMMLGRVDDIVIKIVFQLLVPISFLESRSPNVFMAIAPVSFVTLTYLASLFIQIILVHNCTRF